MWAALIIIINIQHGVYIINLFGYSAAVETWEVKCYIRQQSNIWAETFCWFRSCVQFTRKKLYQTKIFHLAITKKKTLKHIQNFKIMKINNKKGRHFYFFLINQKDKENRQVLLFFFLFLSSPAGHNILSNIIIIVFKKKAAGYDKVLENRSLSFDGQYLFFFFFFSIVIDCVYKCRNITLSLLLFFSSSMPIFIYFFFVDGLVRSTKGSNVSINRRQRQNSQQKKNKIK